ncbi:MAG: type IV pilus twitching motility protein PilT [Gemmatimonadaceae bacterium]|jgi:twitching motility protein PilT
MSLLTTDGLTLETLLAEMIAREASDLHLSVGDRPRLRIDGGMVASLTDVILTAEQTQRLAYSVLTETQQARFEADDELDFSFGVPALSRFRGNVFRQRGSVSLAIRQIPLVVKTFEQLQLPPVVATFAERPRGLVLVTGPTGSGKSTTLAAMIDKINVERRAHILTIEDPIEFVHTHRNCLVNQREVGTDTRSFATALKYALREDPDVILVGEMRDLETVQAALTIAETGHLVLATLHTKSAAEAINRIIDVFPSQQQGQIRAQLAFVLEGIVTQILLPKRSGRGRAMAAEVLVVTPAIRALIRDDKTHQIYSAMQAGKKFGMQTLNDALTELHLSGTVSADECLRATNDPAEFQRMAGLPSGDALSSALMGGAGRPSDRPMPGALRR